MTEQNKQSREAAERIAELLRGAVKTALSEIPRAQLDALYEDVDTTVVGTNIVRLCASAYVPVLESLGRLIRRRQKNEAVCVLMLAIAQTAVGTAHELRAQARGAALLTTDTDVTTRHFDHADARLAEAVLHMTRAAGDIDDRVFGGNLFG